MKINFSLLDEPMEISQGTVLVIEDVSVFAQIVKGCLLYTSRRHANKFVCKRKILDYGPEFFVRSIFHFI